MHDSSKAETHWSISKALGEEHDAILRMLDVLGKVSSLLDSDGDVDIMDLEKINGFLTSFIDKCHHGKEELVLFPAMRKGGGDQRLIKDLLHEHTEGRMKVRSMAEALQRIQSDGRSDYSAASKEYCELLTKHIEKENDIAFPLADKMFSNEQKSEIMEKFEEIEEKRIGLDGHHRLLHDLVELEEKYA